MDMSLISLCTFGNFAFLMSYDPKSTEECVREKKKVHSFPVAADDGHEPWHTLDLVHSDRLEGILTLGGDCRSRVLNLLDDDVL